MEYVIGTLIVGSLIVIRVPFLIGALVAAIACVTLRIVTDQSIQPPQAD